MASKVTLVVEPRGRPIHKLPKEVTIDIDASANDLHEVVAEICSVSVHRLRITKGSDRTVIANKKTTTINDTGLRNSSVIHVKDLGKHLMHQAAPEAIRIRAKELYKIHHANDIKRNPKLIPMRRAPSIPTQITNMQPHVETAGPQIAWRTVFIIEYLGPLLIPGLFLFPLRSLLYFNFDNVPSPSDCQLLVCALLTLHFLKREYETLFVHRFSNATMPARNIFKNSAHYWALAGFNISYWVFSPNAAAATDEPNHVLIYAGLALFVFGELANFNAHLVLRHLRQPGTTQRGIPRGFGFSIVTCPNYFFEIVSWIGVFLVSQFNLSVILFAIVGGGQMWAWAWKKEKLLRKEFPDRYKKKRTVLIPYIC
ncbi:Steroid alpha reductase family protein [Penicillium taxi]|uniref:Steroid alpha reductase family protein n=1 Tax=Penicillium taxi TaxID=168475 RepID=UPI0025454E24|nr:Steroid alpha reductase family protein [Penicillium taxi]KAJ5908810.1 Steroid alpha reductase family protein [Penicillium taxi]